MQALEPAEMSHQLLMKLRIWTIRKKQELLHCDKKTNIGHKEKHKQKIGEPEVYILLTGNKKNFLTLSNLLKAKHFLCAILVVYTSTGVKG